MADQHNWTENLNAEGYRICACGSTFTMANTDEGPRLWCPNGSVAVMTPKEQEQEERWAVIRAKKKQAEYTSCVNCDELCHVDDLLTIDDEQLCEACVIAELTHLRAASEQC